MSNISNVGGGGLNPPGLPDLPGQHGHGPHGPGQASGQVGPGVLLPPGFADGAQGSDGDPATHHHGRPGESGGTQGGSAVHQSYASAVTGAPLADGTDANLRNPILELPSGVAVAKQLSHGNDAVPAGIARQLGDVGQQLASLAAGHAPAGAEARLASNAPLPLHTAAANAAQHAGAAVVPNGVPSSANAAAVATQTAVPQAARGGEALATAMRPEIAATAAQHAANNTAATASQSAAGSAAAQASAAALAAATVAQPQSLGVPQGAPMANTPTVIPTNFINPHAMPQGTTFSRDAVGAVDKRPSMGFQREGGAYTGTGPARERLRDDVRQLPRRMNHWLARMGLVKPDAFARHHGVDTGDNALHQWLYWILAIVAFLGCGLMLASLLPSGGGLLESTSRGTAGGLGLVAGVAAGLGAWWLRSQWRKSATGTDSY